jgi:anti-sigma-K factor RskA
MDYSRRELADRLAAEYVTGTLRGSARRRFEALLPAHPTLRNAVREWQDRLMPLTLSITPQAPSADVWKRIEAQLGGAVVGASKPSVAAPQASWWSGLAFWRGLSGFATAAALGLLVMVNTPSPALAPMVVVLSSTTANADGSVVPASFVASISGDGRAVVTKPLLNVSLQADRALELWAVPGTGAPKSLGLISANGASVVQKNKVPLGTAALAVSLEPPGGSTTGAPSGPVLFVGKLSS